MDRPLYYAITDCSASVRRAVDRLPELAYRGPCEYTETNQNGDTRTCGTDFYVERGEDYVRCPRCNAMYAARHPLDKCSTACAT